jgi:outer membrane protein OmpA-like peptidoglycan-associated protein
MNATSVLICALLAAAGLGTALAQSTAPSTSSMIEQLKSPASERRTRNLFVESVPAKPTPAAAPVQVAPVAQTIPAMQPPATLAPQAVAAPSVVAVVKPTQPVPADEPLSRPALSLNILFDFNSARINTESKLSLSHLAEALQSNDLAGSRFAIEGHTDAKGSADSNFKMSFLRAQAVCDFLSAKGVSKNRLHVIGKGSTELSNAFAPYAAENRRVKIINLD